MFARSPLSRRRRGSSIVVVALSILLLMVTSGSDAGADDRTRFLIDRLKADDFRVRSQAALALGAGNDDDAIQPLCSALADNNDVVRQAVAAALKRLGRSSSLGCMKARLASESNSTVKLQLTRAIETIEASNTTPASSSTGSSSGLDDPPKHVANAKYYVSLSSITNNTGRPQAEIDRIVFAALKSKLDGLGGYQLAPRSETPEAARAVMTRRSLKGYFLSLSVDKFDYDGGNLRVKVKVAVFTYPGKDLRGEVPTGLTQSGVRSSDKSAEDNLLQMCAAHAAELFAQNFQ